MYTPVNPSFTIEKWGARGYKSHGHVIQMVVVSVNTQCETDDRFLTRRQTSLIQLRLQFKYHMSINNAYDWHRDIQYFSFSLIFTPLSTNEKEMTCIQFSN